MSRLPEVPLANSLIRVTRLISGGNPFCGYSHFTPELDTEMQQYFTDAQVVSYLQQLQASGINTLQARGDYHRILHWLELFRRQGGALHWIAQTASEMSDIRQNIKIIANAGAGAIYHHGTQTDRFWHEGRIDAVKDYLSCMRDQGVQVGLGTHIPEIIEYAEEQGWDVDFYMACFYNISRTPRQSALVDPKAAAMNEERFLDDDPARMSKVIRQTPKMCLAFKILAAGRQCGTQQDVAQAFRFAFENIKSQDAVVVGMFPKHLDQIRLNIEHALAALASLGREGGEG